MELDIFLPSLSLAIEYQGEHHFKGHFSYGTSSIQAKDAEKKSACKEHGITLITVPYWWKKDAHSLMKMIQEARADLQDSFHTIRWKPSKNKR
jgi:hypothetical protein